MAALVIDRINDLKDYSKGRFDSLESYNMRQNDNLSKAVERIERLEQESHERKFTCKAAVEVLQKETRYAKFLHWIDNHRTASILLLLGVIFGVVVIVDVVQDLDLIMKLIGLIL
jgi:membrane-bound ClpP family serine protease